MRIADSHEFIELYRGDKDLRMGVEMLKLDDDLEFVSFAPSKASPNDAERFRVSNITEIGLPQLPDRYDLVLLPSLSARFARRESGGIVSLMPGFGRSLRVHAPDVIFENPFSWLTPRSYQTAHYAHKCGVPVVYYDPGDDIPISRKHRIMATWESPVVRRAAAIITYNEAGKKRFVRKYGYPEERIRVIPKPVDVAACRWSGDRAAVREDLGIHADELVVGYVGRLVEYKGSSVLRDVARRALGDYAMSHVRFLFIGGALSSEQCEEQYQAANTLVTGMIPQREVPRHVAACDVVVFPDVTRPGGFPTAVAEVMAAGKAIVLGVGSNTDFMPLVDRRSAWFVEPSSVDGLYEAIACLAGSPDTVIALGRAVGEYALENMDYPVVAARYLEIAHLVCREGSA